jgi:hypothetical protein
MALVVQVLVPSLAFQGWAFSRYCVWTADTPLFKFVEAVQAFATAQGVLRAVDLPAVFTFLLATTSDDSATRDFGVAAEECLSESPSPLAEALAGGGDAVVVVVK